MKRYKSDRQALRADRTISPKRTATTGRKPRGGFGSKLHLLTDSHGLPLAVKLTPGQRQEATQVEALLNEIEAGKAAPLYFSRRCSLC